jgi:hypothetical protein
VFTLAIWLLHFRRNNKPSLRVMTAISWHEVHRAKTCWVARFFLTQKYQNWENYSKWPQSIPNGRKNLPNGRKIYQMAIKLPNDQTYTKWLQKLPNDQTYTNIPRPSEIYPNWDFWNANRYTIWQPRKSALFQSFPSKLTTYDPGI